VGLKREVNQDTILVDSELNLFIVADGMGGHKGGEVASALATETAQEVIRNCFQSKSHFEPKEVIQQAYQVASACIHEKGTNENPELMGMGTTMVLLFGYGNKLYIGNAGDSRVYLYRKPYLWQLTEDHSLINEQIRAGALSEEDVPHVAGRNVITRSVGFEREVMVDVRVREFQPGECYLLCSDGLSSLVSDQEIAEILSTSESQQAVVRCIDKAKAAGGNDNVSVILVKTDSNI